jgi:hypothetical protein
VKDALKRVDTLVGKGCQRDEYGEIRMVMVKEERLGYQLVMTLHLRKVILLKQCPSKCNPLVRMVNSKKFNDPYSLDLARVRKSELGDRRESLKVGKAGFLECNSSDAIQIVVE